MSSDIDPADITGAAHVQWAGKWMSVANDALEVLLTDVAGHLFEP
jgi:hypothetical protein